MSAPPVWVGRTALVAAALLLVSSSAASGQSPCASVSYSVSYSSPFCNVTLLSGTVRTPLDSVWWPQWNGTVNLTTGTGLERASEHVDRPANSSERVAVWDDDGDRNLSAGDVIEVWGLGDCGGNLPLYFGSEPTSLGYEQILVLQSGYQQFCAGNPPLTPFLLLGVVLLGIGVAMTSILLILRRRRARPR